MTMAQSSAARAGGRTLLLVFMPLAGGYFLSYLYRSLNAIIAPDLIAGLGLSAGDLGFLTAAYFLAFALFQLPLGLLLDRYGPRWVQACLILVAAAGAALFAAADGLAGLTLGRALIGLGVSGGLMASFKAITVWLPSQRWPLAQGLFLTAGGLGALCATKPAQLALELTDWRGLFLALALVTCAVSAAIFALMPEREGSADRSSLRQAFGSLGQIYRAPLFWRVAPVAVMTFGFGMSFQGLWAGPWLTDVVGLSRAGVGDALLLLSVMLTLGFALTGLAADRLTRRGVSLERFAAVGVLLYLLTQAPLAFGWTGGVWLVIVGAGLLSNVASVLYPLLAQRFPLALAGRCSTALNLIAFGGAFLVQYLIGAAIDLFPAPEQGGYPSEAYQAAFGAMLGLAALALGWFVRPTTCSAARGA
jgi:MFS family permease